MTLHELIQRTDKSFDQVSKAYNQYSWYNNIMRVDCPQLMVEGRMFDIYMEMYNGHGLQHIVQLNSNN